MTLHSYIISSKLANNEMATSTKTDSREISSTCFYDVQKKE
jgi:hypothetical protein